MEQPNERTQAVGVRAGEHEPVQGGSRRLRGIRSTDTSAVDRDHECPVCGYAAGSGSAVYLHLQIDHRKSELARTLLDTEG
jgi:hypothetical protein